MIEGHNLFWENTAQIFGARKVVASVPNFTAFGFFAIYFFTCF